MTRCQSHEVPGQNEVHFRHSLRNKRGLVRGYRQILPNGEIMQRGYLGPRKLWPNIIIPSQHYSSRGPSGLALA